MLELYRDGLLSLAVKFLTSVLILRLNQSIFDNILPESQRGGGLTGPIKVENGIKHGDLNLIILLDAFGVCHDGILIRYSSTGKVFNIRRFAARTKVL